MKERRFQFHRENNSSGSRLCGFPSPGFHSNSVSEKLYETDRETQNRIH
jgi:hypothetical protein